MAKSLSKTARKALTEMDWKKVDAMTDSDIVRQIASNADAAPDMAPEIDVRAIRHATGMTQAQFAAVYEFSVRTVQEWERGAKKPAAPRGHCCAPSRAIPWAYAKRLPQRDRVGHAGQTGQIRRQVMCCSLWRRRIQRRDIAFA
jgi:DNA-binding transcriptional regulator YiaG